jgi:glycerate kinase
VRIVVAPDKFAGTLTAVQVCEAIREGWHSIAPDDDVLLRPMADGGPGFVEVLQAGLGGDTVPVGTLGPMGEPGLGAILIHDGTAYVESAHACGLHLIDAAMRDAERASSAGVADLLVAALQSGARRIVVGVGGTASTDGGAPMIERLRRLLDVGQDVATSELLPADVDLLVATDVDNPLLGPLGAAPVFGPQKGATSDEVDRLEVRLGDWALDSGGDPLAPGSGAGGGLAFGLFLLGGRRVPGIATCLDAVGVDAAIETADLVVTGEGSFDHQSLRGKVVSGVALRAAAKARPCIVVAGRCEVGRREAAAHGIDEMWSMVEFAGSVDQAMTRPYETLVALAAAVAKAWSGA